MKNNRIDKEIEKEDLIPFVISVVGDVINDQFVRYTFTRDVEITNIGIFVSPLIRNNLTFHYKNLLLLNKNDMIKVSVENIDRVIIEGSLSMLTNLYGKNLNIYQAIFSTTGSGIRVLTTSAYEENNPKIGYTLPTPIMLKRGDTIKISPTFATIPSYPIIQGSYLFVMQGYYKPVENRKIFYARTQNITQLNQAVLIDIPKSTILKNVCFDVYQDNYPYVLVLDSNSGTLITDIRNSMQHLYYTTFSFKKIFGTQSLELINVSAQSSHYYSGLIFNLNDLTVEPAENIVTILSEDNTTGLTDINNYIVYYDYILKNE